MNNKFETNMKILLNSLQLILINFSIPVTSTNKSVKMFEPLSEDIFEKLKTIHEF